MRRFLGWSQDSGHLTACEKLHGSRAEFSQSQAAAEPGSTGLRVARVGTTHFGRSLTWVQSTRQTGGAERRTEQLVPPPVLFVSDSFGYPETKNSPRCTHVLHQFGHYEHLGTVCLVRLQRSDLGGRGTLCRSTLMRLRQELNESPATAIYWWRPIGPELALLRHRVERKLPEPCAQ